VQTALRAAVGWGSPRDYWFPEVRSLGGAVLLMGLVLYPYVYLSARAMFQTQSACLIEVARTLGATRLALLRHVALPLARGRRGAVEAAAVAVGVAVGVVGPALAPLDLPAVGRSEFWHTLLGGLAETGRVPGLAWEDGAIDAYVSARHGVTLGDPGFSQAAKHEYLALLASDPMLPARVTAERLWNFLIGYRPGKESWPYLVAIGLTKLAGLGGWAVWIGGARGEDRRRAIAVGLVVLAPLLAHALIVPLLEVYVAASLIGMLALGAGVVGAVTRAAPPPPRSA
jgi:hypothetical protein